MVLLNRDKEPVARNRILDLRKLPSDQSNEAARWIVRGYEAGAFGIDPKDYFL